MIKTFIDGIQLPINPLEDVTFETNINTKNIDLISFGEIVKLGNRKPIEFTINSIFSNTVYPFTVVANPLLAIDYVNKVHDIINKKSPVRFIITGDKTDINMLCVITTYKHTQKFAEEGEYYYTLKLSEYREPKAKKVIIQLPAETTYIPLAQQVSRQEPTPKQTTYTVKAGDCLWNIAKMYYGNGAKYPQIQDANPKTKTKGIHPGDVLIIPGASGAVSSGSSSSSSGSSSSKSSSVAGIGAVSGGISAALQYFNTGVSSGTHGGGGRSFDSLISESSQGDHGGGGRGF